PGVAGARPPSRSLARKRTWPRSRSALMVRAAVRSGAVSTTAATGAGAVRARGVAAWGAAGGAGEAAAAAAATASTPANPIGPPLLDAIVPPCLGAVTHDPSPPALVEIPGGRFRMGAAAARPDEAPVHEVEVGPFHLGRTPVTRRQYAPFLARTG